MGRRYPVPLPFWSWRSPHSSVRAARLDPMVVDQEKLSTDYGALSAGVKSIRASRVTTALEFLAFQLAYFLAFRIAISFGTGSYSPIWFPYAILLCALLKTSPDRWWIFIVGTIPIRILGQTADLPLWLSLGNIA